MSRRDSAFDIGNGRVTAGDRFELLVSNGTGLSLSGRYGTVIEVLQDGDADVQMEDGQGPYLVKWRQIFSGFILQ